MNELKKLRLKYILWMIPFAMVRVPILFPFLLIEELGNVCDYIIRKSDGFVNNYLLLKEPKWWPTHKYDKLIYDKVVEERKKRLLSRTQKENN